MDPLRIGIVGIGNISGIYLKNLSAYRSTTVTAVADLDKSRAEKAASEYSVPNVLSPDELVKHADVDVVLNLTIPAAHGALALEALRHGKHVYNEKPLSTDFGQAQEMVALAKSKGLLVGCAPDTFLGAGLQTCRKAIDDGLIGDIVGVQGYMMGRGPEGWHPSPEFFYKPGGGPMLDMGPYYLTAMVTLLGPVKRTSGFTRASFATRTVGSGPLEGSVITVETPTHLAGVLEFENGAIGELTTSFDVYAASHHWITIFGTKGTLKVPDPNCFDGKVEVWQESTKEWTELPLSFGFAVNSRGLGVLDMAYALKEGRANRASGDLALHILDIMLSFDKASKSGTYQNLTTGIARPLAMSPDTYADEV